MVAWLVVSIRVAVTNSASGAKSPARLASSSDCLRRGLAAAGRIYRLDLQIRDVPGSLAKVLTLVGKLDANVLEVYHDRTFAGDSQIGVTNVELKLETRGAEHIDRIRDTLEDHGYTILDHL